MRKQALPFLRWAGSKKKQLHILSQFWNSDFKRYVEPFTGSACLFFALQPRRAVLSDVNSELIRTYRTVRDHPVLVRRHLQVMPRSRRAYYAARRKDPSHLNDIEAAARFIYLNRFCFNGLYRTNSSGQFNVPYSPCKKARVPSTAELLRAGRALRRASIKALDFEEILAGTKAGDFVYLDPPFAVSNRRVFRQYTPSSFGRHDLSRLARALRHAEGRGVKFVLSYASSLEAREFFFAWPAKKIFVQRNIAGFSSDRRKAGEMIISNCFPPN